MDFKTWLDIATAVAGFALGVGIVNRHQKSRRHRSPVLAQSPSSSSTVTQQPRPAHHLPVLAFDGLVEATKTRSLLTSIERRTRYSSATFAADCQPVLEAFAEFVQQLPASEAHHHAQPGGLWIHALEVVDAALTFRAGLEIPPNVETEERKRLEHRWTYGVFAGALLHDVGKPVTDVQVMMYTEDPRDGRPWAPLAGPMRAFGAHWYSVGFATPNERDYKAHAKLGGMLLHSFVQPRVLRWLSEDGDVLPQLLAYLSGEEPDGTIGSIIKRADSDSVRRNLAHGPRTRFATARVRPLVERLMEALQRMLLEGGTLPLNRPGAAGWITADGRAWFVCARLADEVRSYLAQHESASGVPGKERNDRLFDTWQEHGAVVSAPDGGAIWRVKVECEGWSPPDPLTVLCFELGRLYGSTREYPPAMRGRIVPQYPGAVASLGLQASTAATGASPSPAAATGVVTGVPGAVSNRTASLQTLPQPQAPAGSADPGPSAAAVGVVSAPSAPPPAALRPQGGPAGGGAVRAQPMPEPAVLRPPAAPDPVAAPSSVVPAEAGLPLAPAPDVASHPPPAAVAVALAQPLDQAVPDGVRGPGSAVAAPVSSTAVVALPQGQGGAMPDAGGDDDDDSLPAADSAAAELSAAKATTTPELVAPQRPKDKRNRPERTGFKGPSPAAVALMAWVANSVGSGALKYNEDGALVHFVPEGVLLLSPEIFRRFFAEHVGVVDGPIAELRASHGDRAFARLQNELAKTGWTVRNGDENLHYYSFVKADKSLSRVASFYLVRQPERFWNPVPQVNDRIRQAPRPQKAALSAELLASASSQNRRVA